MLKSLALLFIIQVVVLSVTFAQSAQAQQIRKPGEKLPQFLYLPFNREDFVPKSDVSLKVSEGYLYSDQERNIHGHETHYGVDFDAPEGTAVYAPCDGIAQAGFHTALVRDAKNFDQPKLFQGMTIGFGLGHFVQIYCEDQKVFVSLAHLREVWEKIPRVGYVIRNSFEYNPDIYYQYPPPIDENAKQPKSRYVKRGTYLGRVGHSGLAQFPFNAPKEPLDFETPEKYFPYSWDSDHLHLEVYGRNEKGLKDSQRRWDPYDHYSKADGSLYNEFKQGPNGLWVTDKKGTFKFAKQ